MPALLRFTGAVERDPAIGAWLDAQPIELSTIARTWFARMRRCGPDVRELMHDGYATLCVDDAPFAYVGAFRSHVNVGFFHGAALPDPAGLLQGTGKYMRHVKLKPGAVLDRPSLEALVAAAYRDIEARLRAATVSEYIDAAPEVARAHLRELRAILKKAAPGATEAIKWGSPVLEDGRILFAYSAYKTHMNFMPTGPALEPFKQDLARYTTGKDTVQFPYGKPLPKALVRRIAVYRVRQVKEHGALWRS